MKIMTMLGSFSEGLLQAEMTVTNIERKMILLRVFIAAWVGNINVVNSEDSRLTPFTPHPPIPPLQIGEGARG